MRTKKKDPIEKIWDKYLKNRDPQLRNQLLEHYQPIVRYTAERVCAKLPDKIDVNDLVSSGNFGLIDAIEAFDRDRGVKFETYSCQRIRGAILDELRNLDWVPRLVRSRSSQVDKIRRTLEAQFGRAPTDQEIASEMGIEDQQYEKMVKDSSAVGIVSLNSTFNENDSENDLSEIDIIKDENSLDPIVEAQKRDLKNLLTKGLSRAERLILVLYYYEELTMKEIGITLDLSESRVSQMHSSVLERLKTQMSDRKKEFSLV